MTLDYGNYDIFLTTGNCRIYIISRIMVLGDLTP